jgi:hypothetical protein
LKSKARRLSAIVGHTKEAQMRVRELQEALSKLDPDLRVVAYTEDETMLPQGHLFRLLDIEYVDTAEGELTRGDYGVPSMRFGKSDLSCVIATLGVTGSF